MYNVLWFDDELDSIMKDTLDTAKTSYEGRINFYTALDLEDFKQVFNSKADWDALILDINTPLDRNDIDNEGPVPLIDTIINECKNIQKLNIPRFIYSGMPDLKGGLNASALLKNRMSALENYGFQRNNRMPPEKAFYWDKSDLNDETGIEYIFEDVYAHLEELRHGFKGHQSLYNIYKSLRKKGLYDASDTIKNLVEWKVCDNKKFPSIDSLRETLNDSVASLIPAWAIIKKANNNIFTFASNEVSDPTTKATIGWLKNISEIVHNAKDKNNNLIDTYYYDFIFIATEKLCEWVDGLGDDRVDEVYNTTPKSSDSTIKDKYIFIDEESYANVTLSDNTCKKVYVNRERGSIVSADSIIIDGNKSRLDKVRIVQLPSNIVQYNRDIFMCLNCINNSIKTMGETKEHDRMIALAESYCKKAEANGIDKLYLEALTALIKFNKTTKNK